MRARSETRVLAVLLGMSFLCALPGVAFAHKIHIFATADGVEISGSVYSSGGAVAAGLVVGVFGPDGTSLGEATTDEDGEFSYTATLRADHTMRIETPDGHGASYTLSAAELPESLPASGADAPSESEGAPPVKAAAPPSIGGDEGDLAARVDLLRMQVIEMRKQLDRFQEKKNFQDILGGVGYIIGIAGVAFYLMARGESGRRGV